MSNRPTKIDQTDARQGKTGVGVRRVLIGGLILVIVAFAIVLIATSYFPAHN